eukprot:562665-Hanusia_phi.AAC.2
MMRMSCINAISAMLPFLPRIRCINPRIHPLVRGNVSLHRFKHIRTTTCTQVEGAEDRRDDEDVLIYVVGGRDRGNTLGVVENFSVKSGTWEKCAHMLEQRGR